MLDLKSRVKEFEVNLPLMEGREKGDLKSLYEDIVTIRDFGFLKDEHNSEYVVFIIDEDDRNFYFGGMVLTDQLKKLSDEGYQEQIVKEGLPIRLTDRISKGKKHYTSVEYYPEADK